MSPLLHRAWLLRQQELQSLQPVLPHHSSYPARALGGRGRKTYQGAG